ncbi:hypothetical protein OG552_17945 [Streptomyces sp. NBC_01476]|uniref:hypothetical protein n=1 Tax=Streptomyces sp. NBC_01476 TaxID=2903881 RepID=UPI002E2FE216|nr:hypothetical protein [Streptomyces sp. NBC_01476]
MAQQHAAQTHRADRARRPSPFSLNSDGRRHPLENSLVLVTLALGFVASITAGFDFLHAVAAWTGVAGLLTGAWGQYISVTTSERYGFIIGLGMSGIGFYIGMAHGGFV